MENKDFQSQEDPSSKNVRCISKIHHEVLLLVKNLRTKPKVKKMNNQYYDWYYTVIKVIEENKDIDNQYENDDNNYFDIIDFVTPNHYIGIKNGNEILR